MALNFPDSPTLNQVYTDSTSGFSYQWNGTVWISYTPASTGNIRVLDDISGSFNGSQNTFALTSSTIALAPPNPQSVIVNLGGVVQDPSDDYTISGSNIIFSTPPTSGLTFSGVVLGVSVPVGVSTGDAYYRQVYTPVGVQTSFNFVNGYTVGYLDVYHNGAKLIPTTDYTATDGLNFSLITASQPGDVVEAIGYRVSAVTIVDGNLNSLTVSGISSLAGQTNITSNLRVTGVTTLGTVGVAATALVVQGDARVTGVLTVGTGSLTLNGSNNSINGVTINAGIVSAVSGIVTYYGDGSNLNLTGNATAGVSSTSSIFTTGIVTSSIIDGFIPADQKVISVNTTLNNGQENLSFAEDLVIGAGVTFTVSTGTTVKMDALGFIDATSVTSATVVATDELDIPDGTIAERPSAPATGSIRWNSDLGFLEFYTGTEWRAVLLSNPLVTNPLDTGIFGGGYSAPASQNVIDYITIATTGNATDFGDLTVARQSLGACSSSTRGVFGGGTPAGANTIDYITISTTGDATDFGDLTVGRFGLAACSSSTRGVFGGSAPTGNVIDYITIATTGNATDFGDLTVTRGYPAACSSSTRGVFGGGYSTPANQNVIDYITIATTGNATDFGDLTVARSQLAACSSSTRGVFGGGSPGPSNVLDYITIATTGNATDFGDLTLPRTGPAACSSSTRGVFGGGYTPTATNTIDYITISTTGNATDFGDLTRKPLRPAACSSAHGGLS
jgi:hypothetical protein